jgi:hypothetical protein
MTSNPSIADEAETFIRERAAELTGPHDNECLCCYVARMLDQFPCDGSHRHAVRFRDLKAPRATALVDRLGRVGACCCDCELFLNGYLPRTWSPNRAAFDDELDDADDLAEDDGWTIDSLPPCAGVRRGSVRPCANWVRMYRRGYA